MRVDLSRFTILALRQEWSIDELHNDSNSNHLCSNNSNDNPKILSNRQHVLLLQQQHQTTRSRSNSGSTSFPSTAEMSKLTFLNVFDSHTPEEIEKLERLHAECKGQLPSRRQLSAIAQSIGIQQSKIKKWFEKQETEASKQNQIYYHNDESFNNFWNELNKKLDSIDNEIEKIKSNF